MDFTRPIEAVIPGARGRILGVLARTDAELNLRTLASLAGVSVAQASRVMPPLLRLGMVSRRDMPPSALFSLVPGHVAVRAILELEESAETTVGAMRVIAGGLSVAPESIIVFGSFARGDGDAESDIDVIFVRPSDVDEDSEAWADSISAWREEVGEVSGNRVEILEVGAAALDAKLAGDDTLWSEIRRDGRVVFGADVGLRANRA